MGYSTKLVGSGQRLIYGDLGAMLGEDDSHMDTSNKSLTKLKSGHFFPPCPIPVASWTLFPLCYGLCPDWNLEGGRGGGRGGFNTLPCNGWTEALCMFTPVQWKRIIHGLVDCGYGGIKGTKKC